MKKDIFEELVVVKRSGQRVNFNNYKIAVAIKQAFDSVYSEYNEKKVNNLYEDVLKYIELNYQDRKTINVEDIQDIIENTLKEEGYKEVYNAFSEYRQKRAVSRKVFTVKQQHKFIKAMEKIDEDNLLRMENNLSPDEILNKYGKTIVKEFSKSYIIDTKFLRAHEEKKIFIHNMSYFPLGILSSTHLNLIKKSNNFIELSFDLINAQKEINGEINIPSLDYLFEEYILKLYKKILMNDLTNYLKLCGYYEYINMKKLLYQIEKEETIDLNIEEYNCYINSKQVESIFIKSKEDSLIKTQKIFNENLTNLLLILNKETNYSISFGTNKSFIGKVINQEIINILNNNKLNNLKTIFKISENTKYINDIINLIKQREIIISNISSSYNKDDDEVEYFPEGIRIFENINSNKRESIGRMVVAKNSLNINRLALKNNNLKDFYEDLEENLELIKNSLLLTFETIGNKTVENYKILFNNNILDDEKLEEKQKIRKVIKNGTLLIGIVGLKECVLSLEKNEDKQYKLLTEILEFLNNKCLEYTNLSKLNFQIYEPSDNQARKEFMRLDKTIYGIKKGITENDKYDLISNLPILKEDYKKQGQVQKKFIGGNLLEINLSINTSDKKLHELINKIVDNDIGIVKIKLGKK